MTRPIIFLGTNSNLIQYVDICNLNNVGIEGIIDCDYFGNTESIDTVPVIDSEELADFKKLAEDFDFFIASNPVIENPRDYSKRQKFLKLVANYNLPCANIIDPVSRIGSLAMLGKGIFVGYSVSISSHTVIGDHCQFHGHSIVGHHSKIGDNVVVQRKGMIGSGSVVGENTFIGVNSLCHKMPGIQIGKNVIVHPGVTVMRDIEDSEFISAAGRRIYKTVVTDEQN